MTYRWEFKVNAAGVNDISVTIVAKTLDEAKRELSKITLGIGEVEVFLREVFPDYETTVAQNARNSQTVAQTVGSNTSVQQPGLFRRLFGQRH